MHGPAAVAWSTWEASTITLIPDRELIAAPVTAWELHRALPSADFVLVDDAGHAFDEPGILDALITATDSFAG